MLHTAGSVGSRGRAHRLQGTAPCDCPSSRRERRGTATGCQAGARSTARPGAEPDSGRQPPVRSGCRSGSVGRSSLTRQSQSPARARAARSRPCPSGAARWPARGVGLSCCLGLSAARRLRGWPMEGGRRDSLARSLSAAGEVSPCRAGSTGSSGRSERCGRWSAGICYCA